MPANTWMTDVFWAVNEFRQRTLSAITLPGTHDAGCYIAHAGWGGESLNSLESRTQALDIGQQLAGGIRYFDIRPRFDAPRSFSAWHGLYTGGRIDGGHGGGGILDQVRLFLEGLPPRSKELVILNISHFKNFTNDAHTMLIARIRAAFLRFLVPFTQAAVSLYNQPYGLLVAGGPRVAILYDGAMDQGPEAYVAANQLPAGFFTVQKHAWPNPVQLFDQYSNKSQVPSANGWTGRYVGVLEDQLAKLNANSVVGGAAGHLHVFSWTCTPQPLGYPAAVAQDHANPLLLPELRNPANWGGHAYNPTLDPKINVVYVDNFASSTLVAPGSPRNGYAMPVAIADLLNRYSPAGWGGGWGVL